ncbi:hypothetical protein [Pseudoxanthomonas winnipegensis]|uniref:Cytochrome c n=1 Tax=Pseudoxanthomonas winnipegensis TaxID=2480810 RepID=A0A4V2HFL1_9GAMM|nr:hypothetical protein [Pseudoxanthomonas winnipegensis]RZZ86767.1 hypothetical protein EA663_07705 [Pseudoxanthomonas winnipegensis]TAA38061.1 hypothetical protein EA656_05330 [Pseudoxanthomonas winnipegensis]
MPALLGIAVTLLGSACGSPPQTPVAPSAAAATGAPTSPAALPVAPLVTLQDLMVNTVDYSADHLWEASGKVIDAQGTRDLRPRTEAEWLELRRHAVVLLEATNLLVIPDRKVAAVAFPSDGPGVNGSDQIQRQIDTHRDQFNAFALGLRAVVQQELAAIDQRDADRLFVLGNDMDSACEACHKANWYPGEIVPDPPKDPPTP